MILEQNKRQTGDQYEWLAKTFLEEKGLVFLVKNFRCRYGEIDLIMRDGEYLVFIEVKYRENGIRGDALSAVGIRKQKIISQVADFYLKTYTWNQDVPCRFDVVGFDGDQISWVQNAFEYHGGRRF